MPLKTDKNFSETEAHTHKFCIQLMAPLEIHYLHMEDFFNFVNILPNLILNTKLTGCFQKNWNKSKQCIWNRKYTLFWKKIPTRRQATLLWYWSWNWVLIFDSQCASTSSFRVNHKRCVVPGGITAYSASRLGEACVKECENPPNLPAPFTLHHSLCPHTTGPMLSLSRRRGFSPHFNVKPK